MYVKDLFDDFNNLHKSVFWILRNNLFWLKYFLKIDISAAKNINIKPERMLCLFDGENEINIESATSKIFIYYF